MLAFAMSSGFTRAEIEAIAALAHLDLEPPEVEVFARQLGDILSYADQVQQVDTAGVAPTASVLARHRADRADLVRPSLGCDEALANAPDAVAATGLFRVPRVIE